jgi:hypothetical protein
MIRITSSTPPAQKNKFKQREKEQKAVIKNCLKAHRYTVNLADR